MENVSISVKLVKKVLINVPNVLIGIEKLIILVVVKKVSLI